MKKLTDSKFAVLDDVKSISNSSSSVPLTISIGVGACEGTLAEKETFAQSALDLALQRGGDQAVIKTQEETSYFGGRAKTSPKGSSVRSRVIAMEFEQLIKKSSNVLVMGHKNADYDALGSCLAVSRIAKYLGVKVNIVANVNDENLAPAFSKLDGEEYDNLFVDAVEAQDLLKSETLTVLVDVNNLAICEAPDVVSNSSNFVIIDHHRKVAEYDVKPSIQYIEPTASSAAELMSEFLQQLLPPNELPKVEADILLAGIVLDTKRFSHNTGIRTFNAALYLRSQNADPSDVNEMFKTDIKDLIREAKYENSVVIYKSVTAIALNENEDNSPLARISAAKAADRLLTVNGVQASFALCKTNDTVFISARSQGYINVQLILEKMGGGGHYDAAGAQVTATSTNTVLRKLKEAIDEYLNENSL
jgi:c-di-AMP phosphodiesterase-like protein